jgi:hypothetical protein
MTIDDFEAPSAQAETDQKATWSEERRELL